jgi:hypothetical protein
VYKQFLVLNFGVMLIKDCDKLALNFYGFDQNARMIVNKSALLMYSFTARGDN